MLRQDHFYDLGYLLRIQERQRAVQMYQRALEEYKKTKGLEHTSTLGRVNNLGILYADLGRLVNLEGGENVPTGATPSPQS